MQRPVRGDPQWGLGRAAQCKTAPPPAPPYITGRAFRLPPQQNSKNKFADLIGRRDLLVLCRDEASEYPYCFTGEG